MRVQSPETEICQFAETCKEKLVKSLWMNLFWAGFSYLKPLCEARAWVIWLLSSECSIYKVLWRHDILFPLKAAVICGCIGIVAELSYEAVKKRYDQGWIDEIIDNLDVLVKRVKKARKNKEVSGT